MVGILSLWRRLGEARKLEGVKVAQRLRPRYLQNQLPEPLGAHTLLARCLAVPRGSDTCLGGESPAVNTQPALFYPVADGP